MPDERYRLANPFQVPLKGKNRTLVKILGGGSRPLQPLRRWRLSALVPVYITSWLPIGRFFSNTFCAYILSISHSIARVPLLWLSDKTTRTINKHIKWNCHIALHSPDLVVYAIFFFFFFTRTSTSYGCVCLCPSVSVCLSQVGVLSKRLNESSWFWHGSFLPSILDCVKNRTSSKISVFHPKLCSKLRTFRFFLV